jgi:acyl dehydratase
MPIYYPDILSETSEPVTFTYGDKDVMLYALGVGFGDDPLNEAELRFVTETDLKVVPTAATVLAASGGRPPLAPFADPSLRVSEINHPLMLHGEQKVELHRPLPAAGTFTAKGRNGGAWDKGKDKGAVVYSVTDWFDEAGERIATLTSAMFARGDGGFGGPTTGAPEPHPTPTRAPDKTIAIKTRPGQALLYRLNGDRNPLHNDPASARKSGFERPILHGLCTYGITCRAILESFLEFDADQVKSHQVRFSAPTLPGDTLQIDMWKDSKEISFEARAKERGVTVIKNGLCVLR